MPARNFKVKYFTQVCTSFTNVSWSINFVVCLKYVDDEINNPNTLPESLPFGFVFSEFWQTKVNTFHDPATLVLVSNIKVLFFPQVT